MELEGENAEAFACCLTRRETEKQLKFLTADPEIPIRVFAPENYLNNVRAEH